MSAAFVLSHPALNFFHIRAAYGTVGGNFYHDYEVSALIVDETIMIHQPPRYAASGMLDAMAKYVEVQHGHSE